MSNAVVAQSCACHSCMALQSKNAAASAAVLCCSCAHTCQVAYSRKSPPGTLGVSAGGRRTAELPAARCWRAPRSPAASKSAIRGRYVPHARTQKVRASLLEFRCKLGLTRLNVRSVWLATDHSLMSSPVRSMLPSSSCKATRRPR